MLRGTGTDEVRRRREEHVSRAASSNLVQALGFETEDPTLELVRMRSLVGHLGERLEKVEEGRSFDSASSGRLGYVDHVALSKHLAQLEATEARAQGPERGGSKVRPPSPPPPPPPSYGLRPGLGPITAVPPVSPLEFGAVWRGNPVPAVHHICLRSMHLIPFRSKCLYLALRISGGWWMVVCT